MAFGALDEAPRPVELQVGIILVRRAQASILVCRQLGERLLVGLDRDTLPTTVISQRNHARNAHRTAASTTTTNVDVGARVGTGGWLLAAEMVEFEAEAGTVGT